MISIQANADVEIDGQVFEEPITKYIPIATKGYGCEKCSYLMVKVANDTTKINKAAIKEWLRLGVVCNSPTDRTPFIEIDPRDVDVNTTLAYYKR